MRKPEQYRTVKQPKDSSICGACLVTMITGFDLDRVQAEMTATTRDGHLYYQEKHIVQYLAGLGIFTGMRAIPLFNPLHPANLIEFTWEFYSNPAILSVKSKVYDDSDHWVFWDGHHVRDSSWANEDETSRLKDYHVLEIITLSYTDDFDLIPPPGEKLHGINCKCVTCLTLKKHNQRARQ